MSELSRRPNLRLTPAFEPEEAIFSTSYDHAHNLIIDWNDYKEPYDAIAEARPRLEQTRRSNVMTGFAIRTFLYEAAYVGIGTTLLPGGLVTDLIGGTAVLGAAGYRAKKSARTTFDEAIAEISPAKTIRETLPSRRISIPQRSLALTIDSDGETVNEDDGGQTINTLELLTLFDERYPSSRIVTYTDPEQFEQVQAQLSELRQQKMEIYVRTLRKQQGKKFKPEDVTEEHYKRAKKKLAYSSAYNYHYSDFKSKDRKSLKQIKRSMRPLKETISRPPIDDKPTYYINVQRIVKVFSDWLNDRSGSMDALTDIYELSSYFEAGHSDDPQARQTMLNALERILQRTLYTT